MVKLLCRKVCLLTPKVRIFQYPYLSQSLTNISSTHLIPLPNVNHLLRSPYFNHQLLQRFIDFYARVIYTQADGFFSACTLDQPSSLIC